MKIRRIDLADLNALQDFYHKHYPSRPKLHDKSLWRWQFRMHPNVDDCRLPFFVIEDNGAICGTIGAIPAQIEVNGNKYSACHPVNYFIDPNYKGLPALRLLKAVMAEYTIILSANLSHDARKLFNAARSIDLSAELHDYFFTLQTTPMAEASSRLKNIMSHSYQIIRTLWVRIVETYLNLTGESPRLQTCNHAADLTFPQPAKNHQRIGLVKDMNYIRWRYEDSPALNCTYYSAQKRGHRPIVAIVHTDLRDRRAVILDILGPCEDTATTTLLLVTLIKDCKKRELVNMSTTILSKSLGRILTGLLFRKAESTCGLMINVGEPQLRTAMSVPSNWHYVLGDTDRY